MKILFLLTQDLESPSGLGRFWPMARALASRGHEVHIVALHPDFINLKEKKFIKEKVAVEYVAQMHVMKDGRNKTYYHPVKLVWVAMVATYALIKAAFSIHADIIQVCKPHPMNSIAGLLVTKIRGSVLCLDCDDYESGSSRFSNSWQQSVVTYFEKIMPRFAAIASSNTHFMINKIQSWGCPEERILYLPNGIDIGRFIKPYPQEVNKHRAELSLDEKRVVLYLGSMSLASHAVDLLLRSFVQVVQEFPDAILLLVGGGEDYQKLVDLSRSLGIQNAVIFLGRVPAEQVSHYYALSEVSVDPVLDDDAARGRSPLKLFESWACGVPFVTAPVGDRPSLLGDPPAGRLAARAGDPTALADEIKRVLGSKEKAEELRIRGLNEIERYTWERLIIDLEKSYKKLIK